MILPYLFGTNSCNGCWQEQDHSRVVITIFFVFFFFIFSLLELLPFGVLKLLHTQYRQVKIKIDSDLKCRSLSEIAQHFSYKLSLDISKDFFFLSAKKVPSLKRGRPLGSYSAEEYSRRLVLRCSTCSTVGVVRGHFVSSPSWADQAYQKPPATR